MSAVFTETQISSLFQLYKNKSPETLKKKKKMVEWYKSTINTKLTQFLKKSKRTQKY